jgi:hypothetical protein
MSAFQPSQGHAICGLEWASSFRACGNAGPAPSSRSYQDDTVSAAIPQARQGKYLDPLSFLFAPPRRSDRGSRGATIHAGRNEWLAYCGTPVFTVRQVLQSEVTGKEIKPNEEECTARNGRMILAAISHRSAWLRRTRVAGLDLGPSAQWPVP